MWPCEMHTTVSKIQQSWLLDSIFINGPEIIMATRSRRAADGNVRNVIADGSSCVSPRLASRQTLSCTRHWPYRACSPGILSCWIAVHFLESQDGRGGVAGTIHMHIVMLIHPFAHLGLTLFGRSKINLIRIDWLWYPAGCWQFW